MWVMAVGGGPPGQGFSPGADQTTPPGRVSPIAPPPRCARPAPPITTKGCPRGCVCHTVRAPGSKVTAAPATLAGAGAVNSGSMRTVPVNQSAGPFPEGCEPARLMSMLVLLAVLANPPVVQTSVTTHVECNQAH